MLGAAQVQVPKYDLYDLKLTREEDGAVETLDPQFCMRFEWLKILEPTVLDLLLDPTFVMSLSFPDLLLLGCVCFTSFVDMDFLGGTTLVEMILVKGHVFPSIVKICLIDLGLEVSSIRRIQGIGYGVLEFLGVRTTHGYAVSSLMDTACWSSE
ncbi:hypothetical protein Tco_1045108 [Tanacetum coccineum]|uniref:Uncharacterized protein n=1 Tax=Tanacetum coccineum TaxID=301880 RepID=A0ABQ5GUB9_9ASTR